IQIKPMVRNMGIRRYIDTVNLVVPYFCTRLCGERINTSNIVHEFTIAGDSIPFHSIIFHTVNRRGPTPTYTDSGISNVADIIVRNINTTYEPGADPYGTPIFISCIMDQVIPNDDVPGELPFIFRVVR